MLREGRGRRIVGWIVLVALCTSSVGCTFSVNYDLQRQTQSKPATNTNTNTPPTPIVLPPPAAGEIQRISYNPDRPTTPEGVAMPSRTDAAPVLGAPDKPRGADALVPDPGSGIPPVLANTYAHTPEGGFPAGDVQPLPKELEKKSHPTYVIEPPDILIINTNRLIPRPPYVIQPLDVLGIQATKTLPDQPINGQYTVSPDGTVALGFGYGSVRIVGMTLEQARLAIQNQLTSRPAELKDPQVSVALLAFQTAQEVQGLHLVRPDGTISLGMYGCVYIAGMTLCQAQAVIEQHLSHVFQEPELSLDIYSYNSKAYYVIFDGGGYGQTVLKFPITGNETVLDAIYNAGGLPAQSSRRRIWVARPAPACHECLQILPVDWLAIVQGGSTRTNYQLFPGDRVYVRADPLIQLDNALAKIISPIERVFGIILLGTSVVRQLGSQGGNNGNGGGGFFFTGF